MAHHIVLPPPVEETCAPQIWLLSLLESWPPVLISFRFSDFFNPYVFLHLYVLHLHIYVLRTRQLEREAPQVNGPSSVCGSDHRPGRDGSSTVTDVHEIHDR